MTLDLGVLRDRLHAVLPSLTYELVELQQEGTGDRLPALSIETTDERKKDHVYKMTIAVIDDHVTFFVHVWGTSKDLSTQGTQRYRKACADVDEVFAIVHSAWTGGKPS